MKNKPHILVLGAGLLQGEILKEINRRGLISVAADQNPDAVFRSLADHFLNVSTRNPQDIIKAVEASHLKEKITHCITVATDMTVSAASINKKLNLCGPSLNQTLITTHKARMREFLTQHQFLQPRFKHSSTKEECYYWLEKQTAKTFVIKPVENMGARGVIYLPKKEDISFSFELAERESISKEVVIEEFIEGDEISVDALVYEGKCYLTGIADRIIRRFEDIYFVEVGHNMPTSHSKAVTQNIEAIMQSFADALGEIESRPYHGALKGDLILMKNKKILINEIASRLSGGFMSTHTFRYSSGLNLMGAYLNLVLKEKKAFDSFINELSYFNCCIERAIIVSPGLIEKVELPDKLKTRGGVIQDVFLNYSEGDISYPLKSNLGKFGHVIIQSQNLKDGQTVWSSFRDQTFIKSNINGLDHSQFRRQAKKNFNPKFCWVCRECNGLNCASSVPGMGGVDRMLTFQENIKVLQNIKILPQYISEFKKTFKSNDDLAQRGLDQIKMDLNILNVPTRAPVLTAPITGSITNMGASISEWDYAYESGSAAKMLGLIPTFGDGASPDKYWTGLRAIEKLGVGFPVFKPREDTNELRKRIKSAEKCGAKAWGMDVDAVWFKTMRHRNQKTNRKTLSEIVELKKSSALPFFLKGIMRIEDAELACRAGASAIIVSNHGGRILDSMPATATVLATISGFVRKEFPHVEVLVDGGIRSGADIFKMLALGAKAVLIGRPVVISTVACQRIGAYYLLKSYIDEFKKILQIMGLSKPDQIRKDHILQSFQSIYRRPQTHSASF